MHDVFNSLVLAAALTIQAGTSASSLAPKVAPPRKGPASARWGERRGSP